MTLFFLQSPSGQFWAVDGKLLAFETREQAEGFRDFHQLWALKVVEREVEE